MMALATIMVTNGKPGSSTVASEFLVLNERT
jgi:hypothetical protein